MPADDVQTFSQSDARSTPYPSRGRRAASLPRREPTVWQAWHPAAPLDRFAVERYARDGFLILNDLFDDKEVIALQAEAQRLRQSGGDLDAETLITEPDPDAEGGAAIRTIFALHRQSPLFARLAEDSRLVRPIEFLLNDDLGIMQSRLNDKPGFRGQPFQWHSDFETWHTEDGMPRMRAISASVLLSDNDHLNAPLMLIPGSHKTFLAVPGPTPADNHKTSLKAQSVGVPTEAQLREQMQARGVIAATGEAGTVILFDCNLLHASTTNMTCFRRSNAFFVYSALSNALQRPYAAPRPRPPWIAERNPTPLVPRYGPVTAQP